MWHWTAAGLRYETIRRPAGPTDAERKLEELTKQLEVEMRLSPSPLPQSLSPSQQSTAAVSGIPAYGHSLPTRLQRTKRNQDSASQPSCGICFFLLKCSSEIECFMPLFLYFFVRMSVIDILMIFLLCCICSKCSLLCHNHYYPLLVFCAYGM